MTRLALVVLLLVCVVSAHDSWWERDKALHLGGAVVSTTGIYGLARICHVEHQRATWLAVGTTGAVCIGKEVVDYFRPKGCCSWRDLTLDALGITLSAIAIARLHK